MVSLINLPSYQANALLDFSPISGAIDSNRKNALMWDAQNFKREQLAQNASQFDRNFGLKEAEAGRAAALHPLQMDQMRAQTDLTRAKVATEAGGGRTEYGKQGAIFQGPDGKFYSVQFGSRGERMIKPMMTDGAGGGQGVALSPAKGVFQVGDEVIDKSTGQAVRNVGPQIAGESEQKVIGRETGELRFTMPKARAALESANAKVNIVRSKIDQALPMVSNWTVGPGSLLSSIPATQARNLREIINTINANLGFDELAEMRANSPTGGALGQVAVQELELLIKAKTSLDQAQTVDQYVKALTDLKQVYDGAVDRRRRAFEETYAPLSRGRTGNGLPTGPVAPRQFTDRLPQQEPALGGQGMIPPGAVQLLRGDPSPEVVQQFEAKYGPGSARQFLGGN